MILISYFRFPTSSTVLVHEDSYPCTDFHNVLISITELQRLRNRSIGQYEDGLWTMDDIGYEGDGGSKILPLLLRTSITLMPPIWLFGSFS